MSEESETQELNYNQLRRYLADAKDYPQFNEETIRGFAEAFRRFDTDGSDSIDGKELVNCLQAMGEGSSPDRVKDLMHQLGQPETGELNFSEFVGLMNLLYPSEGAKFQKRYIEPGEEHLEFTKDELIVFLDTFRKYEDEDGFLSEKDFGESFRSMGQGATKDTLKKIWNEVNPNGGSKIQFAEFLNAMSWLFPGKKASFEVDFMRPAMKYYQFGRGDILSFLKSFRHFDADGSETIDGSELTQIMNYMGESSNKKKLMNF